LAGALVYRPQRTPVIDRGGRHLGAVSNEGPSDLSLQSAAALVARGVRTALQVGIPMPAIEGLGAVFIFRNRVAILRRFAIASAV